MHPGGSIEKKDSRPLSSGSNPPLSEELLRQHNLTTSTMNSVTTESLIRIESALVFERTASEQAAVRGQSIQYPVATDGSSSSSHSIDSLLRLSSTYVSNASSSAMPMERFAILSPANDPCPWESRRVMTDTGLREGSLETAGARSDAAVIVAAHGRKKVAASVAATAGRAR